LDILPGYTLNGTGEIGFNDVTVPKENLLGELNKGFYHAMDWLDWSRTWVGSWCLGIAEGAFNLAYNYANQRELFGEKIFNFQSLSHQLASLAAKIEAVKLLMYKASMMADRGIPNPKIRSMGKNACCRTYRRSCKLCLHDLWWLCGNYRLSSLPVLACGKNLPDNGRYTTDS
jgi:Acyl-CoA dehydrogenases